LLLQLLDPRKVAEKKKTTIIMKKLKKKIPFLCLLKIERQSSARKKKPFQPKHTFFSVQCSLYFPITRFLAT